MAVESIKASEDRRSFSKLTIDSLNTCCLDTPLQGTNTIKSVHIDGAKFDCQILGCTQSQIVTEKEVFLSLSDLLRLYPQLKEDKYRDELVFFANFLFSGNRYQVIEDIETYKTDYTERVRDEHNSFIPPLMRISAFGVFDVSELKKPSIKSGHLQFYVKDDYNSLPYRVVCEWPVKSESPVVSYEKLSYC